MDEPRRITAAELREIVHDAEELAKGTRVFDEGGLQHLARHGNRVFAEAKGSGSSPYRVTLTVEDAGVRSRCTCMAARSRPVCKHGAALAVAWARAPESFAVGEAPPPGAEPAGAKKKAVKAGRAQAPHLMARGVEQVMALVRELAVPGVSSVPTGRIEQLRAVAEQLRENRLRRLSAQALELADLLQAASAGRVASLAFADLLADLLLTARRVEKHIAGETLEDRYVEELIGRTWRAADRKPAQGLELVEYAYLTRVTSDGYTIRESRFLDLASGAHYGEKQILPAFLAKRTEPKRSWASMVLRGASGDVYPGFAPFRLDLEPPTTATLGAGDLERLLGCALPDTGAALKAFQEHRRDVFAPDRMPVAVRTSMIVASGGRLSVADEVGNAVFLPDGSALPEILGASSLRALLGDVDVEGALPVLRPLAAVIEGYAGLQLIVLGEDGQPPSTDGWAGAARAAGLSAAAISLGEVREELAAALVAGLAGLGPRITEPLAARLADLGLSKQAELLREIAARPEPTQRLDDFVKLYHVLGLGVIRLAGACPVDRERLLRVPGIPAVCVPQPAEALDAAEVSRRRARGTMSPWEAAVHRARHYAGLPINELTRILPHWADGGAAPHVAHALRQAPELARSAAERALELHHGLAAALSAVKVLAAVGDAASLDRLRNAGGERMFGLLGSPQGTLAVRQALRQAADAALGKAAPSVQEAEVRAAAEELRTATRAETRERAIERLVEVGLLSALPALRQAWRRDPSEKVRAAAAIALGLLGDLEMVEPFIDALAARAADDTLAKAAARALGQIGDVRGTSALATAVLEGWKPAVTVEALQQSGLAALYSLMELALREPELAKRQSALTVIKALPAAAVESMLVEELAARRATPAWAEAATVLLRLAGACEAVQQSIARQLLAEPAGESRAEKLLRKAAHSVVAG
jgi:hypothetical protein